MKSLLIQFGIVLTTFSIGVCVVILWLFSDPLPKIDLPQNLQTCGSEKRAELTTDLQIDWRGMILKRFQETPVKQLPRNINESYRLLWVPTFDEPTIIHIWRSDESYFITTKRLNRSRKNLEIGNLKFGETRSLTAKEWQSFINLLQQECFFSIPSNIKEELVHDGASWTLEGIKEGQYHLVYRTLPSTRLAEIFRKMFKLTNIEMEYERYL